jgi:hypothetical protein
VITWPPAIISGIGRTTTFVYNFCGETFWKLSIERFRNKWKDNLVEIGFEYEIEVSCACPWASVTGDIETSSETRNTAFFGGGGTYAPVRSLLQVPYVLVP